MMGYRSLEHGDLGEQLGVEGKSRVPLEHTGWIVSVFLGFGVAQFGEYRNNRELARRALASLQSEVEGNLTMLEPLVPIHRSWSNALKAADTSDSAQSGLDLMLATRPRLPATRRRFRFCAAAPGTLPCRAVRSD
jgi:hypothetical protein